MEQHSDAVKSFNVCDGCGNSCPAKNVHVLTERGYREIHFCKSCFDFATENGMINNAYSG